MFNSDNVGSMPQIGKSGKYVPSLVEECDESEEAEVMEV